MEEKKEERHRFRGFPYEPYSIQIDFMNALYRALDTGGVSMLESPTGTGKTLSMICSALQWVVDRREQQKSDENKKTKDAKNGSDDDDEPDWMRNFTVDKDSRAPPEKKKIKKDRFHVGVRKDEQRKNRGNCVKKEENSARVSKDDAVELSDEEFLLEEYESEEEGAVVDGKSKRKAGGVSLSSSSDEDEDGYSDEEEDKEKLQVYFCSRTHSQLSQFIKELRKTVFASEMKVVSLGSRKNFCINEEVLKLGNSTSINERCLELQKKKNDVSKIKNLGPGGRIRRTKASSGCPMLQNYKLQKQFRNEISEQIAMDIEDLVHLGRNMNTCPYYGSRNMAPSADLIVLPYQSLLSKSSRESLGLSLKNNIVIIDEAHNLADSLISMYNSKVTLSEMEGVHYHVEKYLERFCNLLGPGNRRYVQTLLVLTRAFLQILCNEKDPIYMNSFGYTEKESGGNGASDFSITVNDFLFSLNIDNINLIKLHQYIKDSNIMHKVSSYGNKMSSLQEETTLNSAMESGKDGSILSSFRSLAEMLLSLTNNDGDGRIIISRTRATSSGQQEGYIKYVMLTGEKIFSEIINQAHAVVLAGGTLQPIEETKERLFPWLSPDKLHFFSCSHIVPPESILPVAVSRGPSGQPFDFSYSSRSSSIMIQELGLLLCNLTTVVPAGIVVFFSSFDYEGMVYDTWNASGILERIMKKKLIFREPRKNTDVELVLKQYKETIDALSTGDMKGNPSPQSGAILLAIVGGKISEGINLSDGMGRCIVMVGLPYPSPSDLELMERVKYIEGLQNSDSLRTSNLSVDGGVQAGFDILRSCRHRGKEYYENLCSKAVNQSIGRAIRHINDYAAILLVDSRYAISSDCPKRSFAHPTSKLPQWIRDRLVSSTHSYGEVHGLLHQFFRRNSKR